MGRAIVVSGTPGTGKTSVSKLLAKRLDGIHLELSRIVEDEGLWLGRDEERGGTLVVDAEKLADYLRARISGSEDIFIVDTHYGELVPPELVDHVFVLRLEPCTLWKRLEARGWPSSKVRENVEAEILGVCSIEARSVFGEKVCDIDTTGKDAKSVVEEILSILEGLEECGVLDWLEIIGPEALDVLAQGSSCTSAKHRS